MLSHTILNTILLLNRAITTWRIKASTSTKANLTSSDSKLRSFLLEYHQPNPLLYSKNHLKKDNRLSWKKNLNLSELIILWISLKTFQKESNMSLCISCITIKLSMESNISSVLVMINIKMVFLKT